ncbi:MAG TPA: CSLREA domain-containing protein [Solirubrobacterales bacterium]|nr:CSLREA domain-containing protein [Solirubrobacterales bacterium]
MIFRSRAAVALLAALFILAVPAAASAAVTVNTTADEPDAAAGAPCETAGGKCSLRAAIEVTNLAGTAENVLFDATVFEGQLADTITLSTPLPAIKAPISINAGTCTTAALIFGPCAGVSGPTGNFGISVEADGVTISRLAVTGALTGINVINESASFTALGNWVGVKLDGSAGANNTGIFIDPQSDQATIGGSEAVQRNVISGNNNEGLDMQGASGATIRGNFFGVAPDGTTQMGNAIDIEITDSTSGLGAKAEENEIGAQLSAEAAATPACEAACNVISGAISYGIDLSGVGGNEAPASGPTVIAGNHIGLAVTGVNAVANGQRGILVGGADNLTIGGPASEYANHITGGVIGILAGKAADNLGIESNSIGIDASGNQLAPPSEGINVSSEEILTFGGEAEIVDNAIAGTGTGITQHSVGALIAGNEITDPGIGIYTYGTVSPHGNAIVENTIVSASLQGILVENDENVIVGNKVIESGEAGIRIQRFFSLGAVGNLVGGDAADEENLISDSGGPAIEIEDFENTNNEIARNTGSGNGGSFIDLISTEPGSEPNGPNEGIKPPVFSTAIQSKAEGTAEPGALVRVFRKDSAEPGELSSFLGETQADGGGNWKLSYAASLPVGTIVAATQTNGNGGTSELATAASGADPSNGGGGTSNGGGGNPGGGNKGGGGNAKDKTPPDTRILKGPPKKTHKTTVKFRFSSTEAGSTFQCKLDRKPFKKCASPKKYKKLKPGKHVFKVRAIDKAGNVDPTPAKRKFTVLK